jgi:mannosyltransferase
MRAPLDNTRQFRESSSIVSFENCLIPDASQSASAAAAAPDRGSAAPSTGESVSSRWPHWLALFLLTSGAAAIRVVRLGAKPFWFDECFSVELARLSWGNFLHLLWWREANMSLYYLLLRIWLAGAPFSAQSESFVRGLSVVFSAATVPAIYWLGKLLFDRRVGLVAAALFTFNIYSIRYSQEARSYALFVLLATLSSGFLIAFLRNPTPRHRKAYVVCSILAMYAHFYALLLLAAHWIALRALRGPRTDDRKTGTSAPGSDELSRAWRIISMSALPLLIFVAKTGAGPIRWIPRPGLSDLGRFAISFTNGLPLIYGCACLVSLIPVRKNVLSRGQGWEGWCTQFLFVWLLFPTLLTVALSFARPVFLPRYMIFCLPALVILVAAGLVSIRPAWLSVPLTFLVLLLSTYSVHLVYNHDFDDERDAAGAATDFILDHTQPGDAIVLHIAEARVPYEFFRSLRAGENSSGAGFTKQLGPEILFPHSGAGLNYHDFTGKPTAESLRVGAAAHARLWVMLMYNETAASQPDLTTEQMDRVLAREFSHMQRWEFPRVEVRLYEKN